METRDRYGKCVYVLLCLALLALAAYQFYTGFIRFPAFAPDYQVFAGAVQALDHQQDPYIPGTIGQFARVGDLQFIYPPHTLYFFWFLQFVFLFRDIGVYYAFLTILLIVSGYLVLTLDRDPHPLFLSTLIVAGFTSLFWNFAMGNKDILFLFLFAIIFALLVKEKYWQSSVVMGLTAGVSLFATPFAAIFLAVRRPVPERLAWGILSVAVVGVLFLMSYWINPVFLVEYIGILRGETSPFLETGGVNIPTPYLLIRDLVSSIAPGNAIPVAVAMCAYIGAILYAGRRYYLNHTGEDLKIYSLVMLSVFMLLPRIKPYNFIILVIPLYFLFRDAGDRVKTLVLGVTALLPMAVWYLPLLGVDRYRLPLLAGSYIQAYCLILVFLILVFYDRPAPSSKGEETDSGEGCASSGNQVP